MTHYSRISTYISRIVISLALFASATTSVAQQKPKNKIFTLEQDSIPLLRGFSVSFNLVGAAMRVFGDYGQYEGAFKVNLHDQFFPTVEFGVGSANHDDEVTGILYKTSAPFFRIGCDVNLLRNKHGKNRLYGGIRYAFTSFNVDVSRGPMPDPVWGNMGEMSAMGEKCSQHWAEVLFGIETYIYGPVHLGWDVRYRRRISHKDMSIGTAWYVPGFGTQDNDKLTANFNVLIDVWWNKKKK